MNGQIPKFEIRNSKQIQMIKAGKHQIRSTKSETNSNEKKDKIANRTPVRVRAWLQDLILF